MRRFRNINLELLWSFCRVIILKNWFLSLGCAAIVMIFVNCKVQTSIKEFHTDYCTCYPEGTKQNPEAWKSCCISHDSLYWIGGIKAERKRADSLLKVCVGLSGYPRKGEKMYRIVRLFGSPYLPLSWRWGYGWHFGCGYVKPKSVRK